MQIKYNFSAEYPDYKNLLRKFTLDKLIMYVNRESSKLMKQASDQIAKGITKNEYQIVNLETKEIKSQTVYVTAWDLIDLIYHTICASNDYRGNAIMRDDQLYLLLSATKAIEEKNESTLLDKISDERKEMMVWGFAGEQLKFQSLGKVGENVSRELYILFELAKKINGFSDIQSVIVKEAGLSWEKIVTTLYLAWYGSTQDPCISELERHILWDTTLSHEEFNIVMKKYTTTYEEVRESELGRQQLYSKPYIMTSRNERISCNCFLNLHLYEHCIFWVVRDFYKRQKNQQFTSEFGNYFEAYFEEILEEYLNGEDFVKIPETKTKRADWKINLGEHKFLIEQKSTILGLPAKQQEPNIETISGFSRRTICEALEQLESTEREFGEGKFIKIVLLYEDYLKLNLLDCIFKMQECKIINDDSYWVVTIEEMEMLLYTYKHNSRLFFKIVEDKIKAEAEKSNEGGSLMRILEKNGVVDNKHLRQEKYLKYKDYALMSARRYLVKN